MLEIYFGSIPYAKKSWKNIEIFDSAIFSLFWFFSASDIVPYLTNH